MNIKPRFWIYFCPLISLAMTTSVFAGNRQDIMKTLYAVDFSDTREDHSELGFSLDGEFGLISASGNTDATSLKGKLFATHETEQWSNQYEIEGLYTRSQRINKDSEKRTTAQRIYMSGHADYKLLNPDQRIFVFADYEDDRFSAFDYQASIATGWASLKWRDDASSFRYSIGPGFNFSERANGDQDDNTGLIVRASAEYLYKWSSGARLRQFFSTSAGDENTRSRSETSISANIFESLAMKLSLKLDHNSSPKLDDATLNTETSVALVYQFF